MIGAIAAIVLAASAATVVEGAKQHCDSK